MKQIASFKIIFEKFNFSKNKKSVHDLLGTLQQKFNNAALFVLQVNIGILCCISFVNARKKTKLIFRAEVHINKNY